MSSKATLYLEDTPLIPATSVQSVPRSGSLVPWLFAALGFGGMAGVEGYYAVVSVIAKGTAVGTVFGAGALICTGGCAYCLYRFVNALRDRNIQPIQPIEEPAAAKTNTKMLSFINSKLTVILNKSEEIDLENGPSESQLEESITQYLLQLDHILPSLRTEVSDLQEMIQKLLKNKSTSTPASVQASPGGYSGADDSLEQDLLEKLNALSQRLAKASSSKNNSRIASRISSPASLGDISSNTQSSPRSIENNTTNNSAADDVYSESPYKAKSNEKDH